MIVTRTPLRVTFGGGGSDLAPGGFCIAATIDKYVTVTVAESFAPTYVLHYSSSEEVAHASEIRHRLLRDVLVKLDVPPGVSVSTAADIPAGTGLGSSGAFTVGLLRALLPDASKPTIARLACDLDVGEQDQWAATYGGVCAFDFAYRTIRPIETTVDRYLSLHYTGIKHDAAEVLTGETVARPQRVEALDALEADDPEWLGQCLTQQWTAKFIRRPTSTHYEVSRWIADAVAQGAWGAKLVGAGDGGFIMVCSPTPVDVGLRQVPIRFSHEGTRCM